MTGSYFSFDGAISLIFGIACIVIAFFRVSIKGRITFLEWSFLFIGLIYGLSAPLVVGALRENPNAYPAAYYLIDNYGRYGWHTAIVALGTLGLFVGWKIATWQGRNREHRVVFLFEGLDNAKGFAKVFWIFLVVGFLAQYLYSMDYGGLTGVSEYARLVRSGLISDAERSRFSFLRPIAGFSMFAAYGFMGLLLTSTNRKRASNIFGFLLSFSFSIYVLDTWQGRLGIATFIAIVLLGIVFKYRVKPVFLIIGFSLAALLGMYGVYLVSEFWGLKTSESFHSFYVKEIAFIFTGFWAEFEAAPNTFRLFYDVLVMPLFLLPSSWTLGWGWFENIQDVHTQTIWGSAKGQSGVTSAMPLDFITVGYLQMNVLGVFLFALLFGIVLRSLQVLVDKIEISGIRAIFTAYVSLRIAGFGLFYAHPEQLIATNLPLIIILILLSLARHSTRSSYSSKSENRKVI